MYLTENNSVFLHLLELMDDSSDQFFNEFFSIYKPLSNDSKALFAVTFFMKNLHVLYMEKIYRYLKTKAADRHKMLNPVEMLTLLVTSKKENAVKLFNAKTEVDGDKVSFSTILNLMLADSMEKLRDCAANIISIMTESVMSDKSSHIGLLNSYLVPEMAECIRKTPIDQLSWKYYYAFIKLLALCIDRESSAAYNNYLIANLVNYQILQTMPALFERFKVHKSFCINFLQFTVALLCLQEDQVIRLLVDQGFLDIIWWSFEANCRKENIVFSICLKAFGDIERLKSPAYLNAFVDKFLPAIERLGVATLPAIAKLLLRYRSLHAPIATGPVDGQFSAGSSRSHESEADVSRSDVGRQAEAVVSSVGEIVGDMDALLSADDSAPRSGLESTDYDQSLGKREPLAD